MKTEERIKLTRTDITHLEVEAIVNAANTSLFGGGGVDGAIHRAAGPDLLDECRKIGGCPVGEARITGGYHLKARHIIPTVGPVWNDGNHGEDDKLALCYKNCLMLAKENGIHSIAFPAISTGVYRFPVNRATRIALTETLSFIKTNSLPERIIFVCFSE